MTCAVHRPGWLLRILRFLTGPDTKLTFAENLLLVAMKKRRLEDKNDKSAE
jgi:hypothetical protein